MNKQQIRAEVRSMAFDPAESTRIWETLAKMEQFISARTVLLFSAMPTEVQTSEFIREWEQIKTIVLPVVVGNDLELRRYDPSRLAPGYLGILEPMPEAQRVEPSGVDLAVIPGVAFDEKGNRLGHGKGFYDRLLSRLNCVKIGVAYDGQIYREIETDVWDQKVDFVITPSNVYICKSVE